MNATVCRELRLARARLAHLFAWKDGKRGGRYWLPDGKQDTAANRLYGAKAEKAAGAEKKGTDKPARQEKAARPGEAERVARAKLDVARDAYDAAVNDPATPMDVLRFLHARARAAAAAVREHAAPKPAEQPASAPAEPGGLLTDADRALAAERARRNSVGPAAPARHNPPADPPAIGRNTKGGQEMRKKKGEKAAPAVAPPAHGAAAKVEPAPPLSPPTAPGLHEGTGYEELADPRPITHQELDRLRGQLDADREAGRLKDYMPTQSGPDRLSQVAIDLRERERHGDQTSLNYGAVKQIFGSYLDNPEMRGYRQVFYDAAGAAHDAMTPAEKTAFLDTWAHELGTRAGFLSGRVKPQSLGGKTVTPETAADNVVTPAAKRFLLARHGDDYIELPFAPGQKRGRYRVRDLLTTGALVPEGGVAPQPAAPPPPPKKRGWWG